MKNKIIGISVGSFLAIVSAISVYYCFNKTNNKPEIISYSQDIEDAMKAKLKKEYKEGALIPSFRSKSVSGIQYQKPVIINSKTKAIVKNLDSRINKKYKLENTKTLTRDEVLKDFKKANLQDLAFPESKVKDPVNVSIDSSKFNKLKGDELTLALESVKIKRDNSSSDKNEKSNGTEVVDTYKLTPSEDNIQSYYAEYFNDYLAEISSEYEKKNEELGLDRKIKVDKFTKSYIGENKVKDFPLSLDDNGLTLIVEGVNFSEGILAVNFKYVNNSDKRVNFNFAFVPQVLANSSYISNEMFVRQLMTSTAQPDYLDPDESYSFTSYANMFGCKPPNLSVLNIQLNSVVTGRTLSLIDYSSDFE